MAMLSAVRSKVGRGPSPLGSTRLGEINRRSWLIPLIAALILAMVGFWAASSIDSAMRADLGGDLARVRNMAIGSLERWFRGRTRNVSYRANRKRMIELVKTQLEIAKSGGELRGSPAMEELDRRFIEVKELFDIEHYAILTPQGVIIATSIPHDRIDLIGRRVDRAFDGLVERAQRGPAFSPPTRAEEKGRRILGISIVTAAPILVEGKTVAILAYTVDPERFTGILAEARMGETGETYAFNRHGEMVSESRFTEQLVKIGLLEPGPDGSPSTVLKISIRDPGGDMTRGRGKKQPRLNQPLTRMAADAVMGAEDDREDVRGADTDGYADYRGVDVIGAWAWLDEYDFGIATEIDVAEAFQYLTKMRVVFGVLVGLLLLGAVFMFFLSRRISKLSEEVSAAQQLGQYTLVELIGQGAMGKVYRARHAMLRRPTAVKLLSADEADDKRRKRFEREVQLTSRLTHPNTIQIFDYGVSPDGSFYYAMEYLPGSTLDALVGKTGAQPEARVSHIIAQAAGSLAEAHRIGLIHRDIKPANIMLCERGGEQDTVKVLDFGLVKAMEPDEQETKLTMAGRLIGTPLFLAPESIRSQAEVDGRSDLYSLGVVAYYLLTGSYIFEVAPVGEVLTRHMLEDPELPSVRLGKPVNKALEAIIMKCLAKEPDDRFQTAGDVARALREIPDIGPWTNNEYRAWAKAHDWETKTLEDIRDSRIRSQPGTDNAP